MPLSVVSIPIGNPEDLTTRAYKTLQGADLIIGEERKEASKFLRSLEIKPPQFELLNEHSEPGDIEALSKKCQELNVALISDCGTPVFCDPGAHLIRRCRQLNIAVNAIPGASSLMTLLALSSQKLGEFVFRGFLPAKTELRQPALAELHKEERAIILLDTPYRLKKLMAELAAAMPNRQALIGLNLTMEGEKILEGPLKSLQNQLPYPKAEFILLLYPTGKSKRSQ